VYLILFIYILFIYFIFFLIPFKERMHSFWNNNYSYKLAQQLLQYGHTIGTVDNIMKILKGPHLHTMDKFYICKEMKVII